MMFLAAVTAVTGSIPSIASATTKYWDIDGPPAGAGGLSPSGTWNTSTSNWSTSSSGTNSAFWVAGDSAVFSAGTGALGTFTISVSGTQSVDDIDFEEGAVTVQGGTLNLSGVTSSMDVAASRTATITSTLAGTAALVKTNSGTLVLSGGSTRTAANTVEGGVLRLTSATALGTGSISAITGGVLELSNLVFSRPMTLQSSGVLRGTGDSYYFGTITVGGASGAGNLEAIGNAGQYFTIGNEDNDLTGGNASSNIHVGGTGTVSLLYANNYVGGWTIDSGALQIDDPSALGTGTSAVVVNGGELEVDTTITRDIILNNGAVLSGWGGANGTTTVAAGASVTLASGSSSSSELSIGVAANDLTGGAGTATIVVAGSGTVVLTLSNDYSGSWNLSSGTLEISHNTRLGNSGNDITFSGGILAASEDVSLPTTRTITLSTSGGTMQVASTKTLTVAGVIVGSGGALTKTGAGTLILNAVNSYTSGTVINEGTLRLGGSNRLADSGAVTLANTAGAVLDLNGMTETIGALSGGGAFGGNVTLGAGALTVNQASNTAYYAGIISGSGSVTKAGSGTLTITRLHTYTGGTTVTGGTLIADAANVLPDTGAVSVNGGTLTIAAPGSLQPVEIVGAVTLVSGAINVGTNRKLRGTSFAVQSGSISGDLTGTATLTKSGAGIVVLTGNDDYTEGTNINAGRLRLGMSNVLANSGAVTLSNTAGAELDLDDMTDAIGTLSGGGASGGNITLGSGALTVLQASDETYSGIISGGGSFTKTGTFELTLAGVNTYTGGTTVGNGTLTLGAGNVLADSGAVTVSGGTLVFTNSETVGPVTLTGGSIAGVYFGTVLTGSSYTVLSGTISGTLGGSAALVKNGTGVVTLTSSGSYSYTGGTTINAGTLTLGTADVLPDTGAVTVAGGTLNLQGGSEWVGAVTLTSGSITGSLFSFSLTGTSYAVESGTIARTLAGSGALTKSTGGTVSLNEANTYSGGTTINAGTLAMGSFGRLPGTGSVTIAGGTLSIGNSFNSVGPVILTSGSITGTGFTLNGVSFDVRSGTVTAKLGGSGSALTKTTAGMVTLSGANTYTGATNVNAGTLRLEANLTSSSSVNVTGGSLVLASDGSAMRVIKTPGISVTGASSSVDLQDNKLITASSIGSWTGGAYTGILGKVQSGNNGGTWNGSGIVTSMPDALSFRTTLATVSAGEALGLAPTATRVWGGQTVVGTDTLVMYTYAGDLNVDGVINADDYAWIDLYSQIPGSSGYLHGDINYNGAINADDYALIDLNTTAQGDPFAARPPIGQTPSLVAMPEPAVGGIVMLMLPLARRRRR
jgi:autotransporter-associated beta strand protein